MWDYERGPFTDAEKAAMGLATVLSNAVSDHTIPADLDAALHAHFSEDQLMELGMVIAVLVGMARLLFTFHLADEEAGCPVD